MWPRQERLALARKGARARRAIRSVPACHAMGPSQARKGVAAARTPDGFTGTVRRQLTLMRTQGHQAPRSICKPRASRTLRTGGPTGSAAERSLIGMRRHPGWRPPGCSRGPGIRAGATRGEAPARAPGPGIGQERRLLGLRPPGFPRGPGSGGEGRRPSGPSSLPAACARPCWPLPVAEAASPHARVA